MEMELIGLLRVLWRWSWLILLCVALTCGYLYWNSSRSIAAYSANVILLVSTPDREDVSALGEYTFTSDRDEITIVINKFVEIAQYPEVTTRTLSELGIEEDYTVEVDAELGADFIHVTIVASSPELAAQIANAHAANAIKYFGEIRALPSSQASVYFEAEIVIANQELQNAEAALSAFQAERGIASLDSELELQYDILTQLEIYRAELLVFDATGIPSRNMSNGADSTTPLVVSDTDISNVDTLIIEQRAVLAGLATFEAEYKRLQDEVTRTTDDYNSLSSQLSDVEMREAFSGQVMFIQVIQAATIPDSLESEFLRTMLLGAMGSLGFGILAAFFLDYLFSKR